MNRVDLPELAPKVAVVVPRADYETDRKRGFAVLEFSPKGEIVLRNPRNPESTLRREVPEVLMFRCMFCKFDAVDSSYPPDPETRTPRRGLELIRAHVEQNVHPWCYTPFDNPYGNIEDVTIEGVEDYTKEIT
jgi:hypothetical protein